jgi:hypothetical protein
MAHDVFVCCAKEDEDSAEAVAAALEARGIGCWIAPRDVPPGLPRERATADAIDSSRVVVLVLSSSSDSSPPVLREIEHAASRSTPIISFQVEDTPVSGSMQRFIGSFDWVDAFTPPLEQHFPRLGEAADRLLRDDVAGAAPATEPDAQLPLIVPPEPPARPASRSGVRRLVSGVRRLLLISIGVIALAPVALAVHYYWGAHPASRVDYDRGVWLA